MDIAHNTIQSMTICPGGASGGKTLGVHDHAGLSAVQDAQVWGNPYTWVTLMKAFSKSEGWMKTTKASEVKGLGCFVQVTTQQGAHIAESIEWTPGVCIETTTAPDGTVTGRRLSPIRFWLWKRIARAVFGF